MTTLINRNTGAIITPVFTPSLSYKYYSCGDESGRMCHLWGSNDLLTWAELGGQLPTDPDAGNTYNVVAGNGVLLAYIEDCTSIFRSTDGGNLWAEIPMGEHTRGISFVNGMFFLGLAADDAPIQVEYSTDGSAWSGSTGIGDKNVDIYRTKFFYFKNAYHVLAQGDNITYHSSSSSGIIWSEITTDILPLRGLEPFFLWDDCFAISVNNYAILITGDGAYYTGDFVIFTKLTGPGVGGNCGAVFHIGQFFYLVDYTDGTVTTRKMLESDMASNLGAGLVFPGATIEIGGYYYSVDYVSVLGTPNVGNGQDLFKLLNNGTFEDIAAISATESILIKWPIMVLGVGV